MKPQLAPVALPQSDSQASPDTATIIGITLLVFSLCSLLHEGLGHGGGCLLTGGKAQVLTAISFDCSADNRLVDAGGTIVNLFVGFLGWGLLHLPTVKSARSRYFVWLLMAVNLLQGGGYFLYSGIANIGDWAGVIQGLHPAWLWRVGLTVLGIISYWPFVVISARELQPFLGGAEDRWRRARRLTLIPYFTGGILVCVAGSFNPVGMLLVGISAAAATFGGTSGLIWMPQVLRGRKASTEEPLALQRSYAWMAAGAIAAAIEVAVLGPGIRFHA